MNKGEPTPAGGTRRSARSVVLVAMLTLLGAALAFSASPSSAREPAAQVTTTTCDPIYGCQPTTSTTAPLEIFIRLRVDAGPVGLRLGVQACRYAVGTAGVITFDGQSVGNAVAGSVGCMQGVGPNAPLEAAPARSGSLDGRAIVLAAAGRAATNAQTVDFPFEFIVPDLPIGDYQVCSVAAGYPTPCATFTIIPGTNVSGSEAGNESSRGGLAFTGIQLALMLAIALLLVVAGRALLAESRRRRRQAAQVAVRDKVSAR